MLSDSVWDKLQACASLGLVAVRLHPESRFNIFAALEPATGHRFLVLKSGNLNLRPQSALPSGRGFNVQFVVAPGDADGPNCLRFEMIDSTYSDVFDVIGNDVLRHVLVTHDDSAAFVTFVERIADWQRFLDQLPREGLSDHAQQGLFAELWFMREFLLAEVGPERAVAAWAGPKALAKDFHLPGLAIEIKASAAKQHTKFHVSNEMQLDPGGVHRLIVYGLLLERLVAGGMSITDLVSALRADLLESHPSSLVRFSELLLQTGYTDADASDYTARFSVRSQHFFDVKEDFPRIVAADLRRGVGDVRYSILLSECERHTVSEDELRRLIRATS